MKKKFAAVVLAAGLVVGVAYGVHAHDAKTRTAAFDTGWGKPRR